MHMMDLDNIKRIKNKYQNAWLKLPGVVAVGVGILKNGAIGIIVSVEKLNEALKDQIPDAVEDVPVEIQVTGKIKAL